MSEPFGRRTLLGGAAATLALSGCIDSLAGEGPEEIVDEDGPVELDRVDADPVASYPAVDTSRERTLLYFFATWCEPCKPQNESLAVLQDQVDDDRIAIHGVSPESDPQLVGDYWAESPSSFPALIDPDALVTAYYGVSRYPTLLLVDSEGQPLWQNGDDENNRAIGTVSTDVILEKIEAYS